MDKNLLIYLFIFLIFILALGLILVTLNFNKKYYKLYKYLYNFQNAITSARYGNLNIKIQSGFDSLTKKLTKNTNALLESIVDRDKMIQEYIQKEQERQNLKQDFITTLAHDLKVPIIAQDNTYDLFLGEYFGKISKEQETAIKNLKISNDDLKKLILNLLDVQKYENNSLLLHKEKTEIISLVEEIIEQDESIFKIQNKNLFFNHPNEKIYLNIDKFLIKRVVNNLITNAIVHSKNSKNIEINLEKNQKEIFLSIVDEGTGINENDINNIFEKYYTSSKKYTPTSTGLGLYIANKIVLAHSGKIAAKNNKDKGATFTITLPF